MYSLQSTKKRDVGPLPPPASIRLFWGLENPDRTTPAAPPSSWLTGELTGKTGAPASLRSAIGSLYAERTIYMRDVYLTLQIGRKPALEHALAHPG
jgi:hypothetical protein